MNIQAGNNLADKLAYCGDAITDLATKSEYLSIRDKTFRLEKLMKELPQLELKVKHHFSKGVYARELHIPANTTLTGEIHKFENLNILSQGTMLVSTEEGIVQVEAPFTVVSPAGTKRIAHTLTDCILPHCCLVLELWYEIFHNNAPVHQLSKKRLI